MRKSHSIEFFSCILILLIVLSGCSATKGLDVVGKQSAQSFDAILQAMPGQVNVDAMNGGFSLAAPDNTVRFIWSQDYSKSALHDLMLELPIEPFVNAGLDTTKLPENYTVYDDMLMVGIKLGNDVLSYSGTPTPLAAYEHLVDKYRSTVGYHTAMDHFNVSLGDGNMFEWAKDMAISGATNEEQDKDIVFVLNPEPFIAAGVNPDQVEGWVYSQVKVDIDGKPTDVWKFLKPFNIK